MAEPTTVEQPRVGPVLTRGPLADALVAAIRELNQAVEVVDRGAYLRVLVPGRCRLTRQAVERRLGEPFALPADLEGIMPAFAGQLSVDAEEAVWS